MADAVRKLAQLPFRVRSRIVFARLQRLDRLVLYAEIVHGLPLLLKHRGSEGETKCVAQPGSCPIWNSRLMQPAGFYRLAARSDVSGVFAEPDSAQR